MQKHSLVLYVPWRVPGSGPTLMKPSVFDRYRRETAGGISQNLFDGRYEADHHARRTGRTRQTIGVTAYQRRSVVLDTSTQRRCGFALSGLHASVRIYRSPISVAPSGNREFFWR